jgi:cupredoxin-like protein
MQPPEATDGHTRDLALSDTARNIVATALAVSAVVVEDVQTEGLPTSGQLLIPLLLQWSGDGLLAFVLASIAIWIGARLFQHVPWVPNAAARSAALALLISLSFALILVPASGAKEAVRRLVETGTLVPPYIHGAMAGMSPLEHMLPPIVVDAWHAFTLALASQVVGFPIAAVALIAVAYWPRLGGRIAGAGSEISLAERLVASMGVFVGSVAVVYVSWTVPVHAHSETAIAAHDVHMSIFGEYTADPTPLRLLADRPVTLIFDNSTQLTHEIVIPDLRIHVRVRPGETTEVGIPATPVGMYHWECATPGHADAGMQGWVIFGSMSPSDHTMVGPEHSHT